MARFKNRPGPIDEATLVRNALNAWERDGAAVATPDTWLSACRDTLASQRDAARDVQGALVQALNGLQTAGVQGFRREQLEAELAMHAPEETRLVSLSDDMSALVSVVGSIRLDTVAAWRRAAAQSVVGTADDLPRLSACLQALAGVPDSLLDWPDGFVGYLEGMVDVAATAALELAHLHADGALAAARRRRGQDTTEIDQQLATTQLRAWLTVGAALGIEVRFAHVLVQARDLLAENIGNTAMAGIGAPWLLPEWLLYWQIRKRAAPALAAAGTRVSDGETAQYQELLARTADFDERWRAEIPRLRSA